MCVVAGEWGQSPSELRISLWYGALHPLSTPSAAETKTSLSQLVFLFISLLCIGTGGQSDIVRNQYTTVRSLPLGTNIRELLNTQKRDSPSAGPSYKNSWPRPLPHLPQLTWNALIKTSLTKQLKHDVILMICSAWQTKHICPTPFWYWLYLYRPPCLRFFGDTVLMDGLREGRPRRGVLKLRRAAE